MNSSHDIRRLIIYNTAKLDSEIAVDFLENVIREREPDLTHEVYRSLIFLQNQKDRAFKIAERGIHSEDEELVFRSLLFFKKMFNDDFEKKLSVIRERKITHPYLQNLINNSTIES